MAKVGYVRVSTSDQNPDRQIDALQEKGVEKIFLDCCSGKDMNRPELKKLLEWVRGGDIIHFESISRLSRNTKDFLELMDVLSGKGVAVVSLKEPIDTSTPSGKMICTIFAAMYEMERSYIKERQREGIEAARKRGKRLGRPPAAIDERFATIYQHVKDGKMTAVMAMRKLGMKKTTFYKAVKEHF